MDLSGTDMGQGFRTGMMQIAAETLDVPEENFIVTCGDTAETLPHRQSVSERQTLDTGRAVYEAARKMREELVKNPWQPGETRQTRYRHIARRRPTASTARPRAKEDGNPYQNYRGYAFLTQCVILEVNKKTGAVKVLHVVSANDTGRAINPQIIAGQIRQQCDGRRLCAQRGASPSQTASPTSSRSGKLGVLRAQDTPKFDIVLVEDPHTEGPYGAKGVSEVATVPATPAVLNALHDALGVRFYHTPVRPADILKAIQTR